MRISDLNEKAIAERPLAVDLVRAWSHDHHEWGAALTRVIEDHRIRSSIIFVNMARLRFEWVGPTLSFLDDNPERLMNGPISALRDQAFVQGIVANLNQAAAALRPYLCRIQTPLNGVNVSYDMLSLPICNPRTRAITSCMRIPLALTVKSARPAGFDPSRSPLKVSFSAD